MNGGAKWNTESEAYKRHIADLQRQEREMTSKKEEPMPEFQSGEEAYEWMERRLNKSWVDEIFDNPSVEVVAPVPDVELNFAKLPNLTPIDKDEFYKLMGLDSNGNFLDESS